MTAAAAGILGDIPEDLSFNLANKPARMPTRSPG
jgi:hypothetical protein